MMPHVSGAGKRLAAHAPAATTTLVRAPRQRSGTLFAAFVSALSIPKCSLEFVDAVQEVADESDGRVIQCESGPEALNSSNHENL